MAPEQLIVVHDDVDLPFDTVRLKFGGGEGGHNGLRDIVKALGTKDFNRIRMGVGRPPGSKGTADFVLSRFSAAETKILPMFIDDGADATISLIATGLLATQQRFHAKAAPPSKPATTGPPAGRQPASKPPANKPAPPPPTSES